MKTAMLIKLMGDIGLKTCEVLVADDHCIISPWERPICTLRVKLMKTVFQNK